METPPTLLERLARTVSKMFLILVMTLGNPPLVTIWEQRRRPIVALVMPVPHRGEREWPDGGPPDLPAPSGQAERRENHYIPVRAA